MQGKHISGRQVARHRIHRAMTEMILAADDRAEAAADDEARAALEALRDRLGILRARSVGRWSRP
jgi:hypothetical protein